MKGIIFCNLAPIGNGLWRHFQRKILCFEGIQRDHKLVHGIWGTIVRWVKCLYMLLLWQFLAISPFQQAGSLPVSGRLEVVATVSSFHHIRIASVFQTGRRWWSRLMRLLTGRGGVFGCLGSGYPGVDARYHHPGWSPRIGLWNPQRVTWSPCPSSRFSQNSRPTLFFHPLQQGERGN